MAIRHGADVRFAKTTRVLAGGHADGTFIIGAQRGEVYRIAGGAPVYVSTWSAFGGQQSTMSVDVTAIDNAGGGGVWNHLNYRPADGTFITCAQVRRQGPTARPRGSEG
jgi:hypothetical protein